jgi:phosphatidylglycerol phospholipase C
VPNISINIHQKVLMGPLGCNFLEEVKAANRQLFVWTVNESKLMRWSIRKEVDGVITDNPARFKQICDEWDDEDDREDGITLSQRLLLWWIALVVLCFGSLFRLRHRAGVERFAEK